MAVALEQRTGGEVRVETGRGVIAELGKDGGRNRQVKIRATHTNLTELVTGWLDTDDAEAAAFIVEAQRDGIEVDYRVEVKRKGDAPADKPIAELGNRQKVRELVLVRPAAVGAETPPDDSPSTPAQEPAAPPPAEPTATDTGASSPGPQNATEPTPAGNGSAKRRVKVAEGKPWDELNTDGSPNVGSYAVQAAAGMVELAVEMLTPDGGPPPAPGKVQALARTLLFVTDEVQAAARWDGHADRLDTSHARARGCVRTALRYYPVPLGADDDERETWRAAVIAYGAALLTIAVRLAGEAPEREK